MDKISNYKTPCDKPNIAGNRSPFADAVAVWHMADLNDTAGKNSRLTKHGAVKVGIELKGDERLASIKRGGDGYVAEFQGGYLNAGQGTDNELNLTGKTMTICVRLRDPSGEWNTPLFSKHGGAKKLVYNLFSTDLGSGMMLGFELGSDWNERPLRISVPIDMIGPSDWHDVIIRYAGPKLELFIDGVFVDEEWSIGSLRQDNCELCLIGAESYDGEVKAGFHGMVDHIALWNRALSDDEIVLLSGGKQEIARRKSGILGEERPIQQYWKPRGHNTNVGDCMPFYHGGRFHLFYLFDRRHHQSKWGLGAHQWSHASTKDLIHWEHHKMAVPITEEIEGSICTGSTFFHDGTYYGFYAIRMADGSGGKLATATSKDGIHFKKASPFAMLEPPYQKGPARDPVVFQNKQTGLFHMLVTTELINPIIAGHGGCLAQLVSSDLEHWEQREPFIIPGYTGQPECPDYFSWHGWYYLVFSNDGIARYRMSRDPLGPWLRPKVDVFDGAQASVLKTAPFKGDRRIGVAFLSDGGYGGYAIFREIIQYEDGTLGTKFPAEMIPASGEALKLTCEALTKGVSGNENNLRISAIDGLGIAMLHDVPKNIRITLKVNPEPNSSYFGLCLMGSENYQQGHELRFEPYRQKAGLRKTISNSVEENERSSIYNVEGLDRSFALDIIVKGTIIDICIDNRRTFVSRVSRLDGNRIFFFAQNSEVVFDSIVVRPLLD